MAMKRRLAALGLVEMKGNILGYSKPYKIPIKIDAHRLVMIPHGRTPSNERLLFQSHAEGPNATLLPESLVDAARGAKVFWDTFGDDLAASPQDFYFVRSPLRRCAQTADAYTRALAGFGAADLPAVAVDPGLLEIDHASWHGRTVEDIPAGPERVAAEAYRAGDFFAAPRDGESCVDVLERAAAWLAAVERPGKVVVVFGHGTFQNAAEVVLRSLGSERVPAEVFTRKHGASHLRRGYPHILYPQGSI